MRVSVIVIILLLFIVACVPEGVVDENPAQADPTATPIPTAPAAARPDLYRPSRHRARIARLQWTLASTRDQLELSFEIGGTIRSVNVRRGDTVTAGQLLADYQITNLENDLASAQLQLESAINRLESGSDTSVDSVTNAQFALADANLRLEEAESNYPWTDVNGAWLNVLSAQESLENAQRAYQDAISDPSNPASVTTQAYEQLQNAENQLQSAQNSYYSAAQRYNNYEFTIAQSENSVLQREIELENAQLGGGNADLIQSVNEAQLRIDQINANIVQSSLFAPIDGVVLEVTISPGDNVQAFNTVMTIAIPEPLEVVANLAFNDIQRLSVGMVGICELMNQPDTAVQCVIRQVPISNRDADQSVRVAATLLGIPSGQLIEVEMPLDVRENVLWLSPEAIRTFQNRTFVVLQTDDGERVQDIQIGLQTDDRVEIVTGLEAGDIVVGQ